MRRVGHAHVGMPTITHARAAVGDREDLAQRDRVARLVWVWVGVRLGLRVRLRLTLRLSVNNLARRDRAARRRGARPEEGVRTTAAVEEVAWRQAAQPADAAELVVLGLAWLGLGLKLALGIGLGLG